MWMEGINDQEFRNSFKKIHHPLSLAKTLASLNNENLVHLVVTAKGTYTAMTYVGSYKEPMLRPYQWYKAFVLAGAIEHGLPTEYIEWLRTFEAQADSNADRRSEREALLFGDLPLTRFNVEGDTRQLAMNEA